MRMCLCPAHAEALKLSYWITECGGAGECGMVGCTAPGREFDMRSKNYRPRRAPRGPAPKDHRARHRPRFGEEDDDD